MSGILKIRYFLITWYCTSNRPFAQLLSGLETGHPAAAGPSSSCDFGVFDEQKAVFLVSVLDFSECDSSGLDHPNSMWSNARVREYFRRKIGHSWTSRKPSFLNGKCAYIVTSHSTHRVYLRCLCDCSEWDPSGLGLDSWNSSWIIARLKEYLKRKRGYSRLPFKKAELLERQVSLNLHLTYTLRVQTRCSSKCNLKKHTSKSLLAQTSPAL